MQAILFFDGAAQCNPGPSGAGWAIKDKTGKILLKAHVYLGEKTNNFAEYTALIEGLKSARGLKIQALVVAGDSNLVISQLNGNFKVRTPALRPLFEEACLLANEFAEIEFNWIPREENELADAESRLAIEEHFKQGGGVLDSILKRHKFKK